MKRADAHIDRRARARARGRAARALLLAVLAGLLGAAPATAPETVRPLSFLPEGPGVALPARDLAGADALGEARMALAEGRVAEARNALQRAKHVELIADQVAITGAEIRLAEGDVAAALAELDALAADEPGPFVAAQIDRVRARALLAAGNEAAAEAAWRRAFEAEREPERRMDVKLEMVLALQAAGLLPADAPPESLTTRVLREASRPDERAPADRTPDEAVQAGDTLLARGRSADAAAAYAEALSGLVEETRRRVVHQRHGIALFNLRRYDEAQRAFEAAGDDAEARFWRGRAVARQGDVPEAMRVFAQLGQGDQPEWASHALFLLGTLQAGRGETAAARESFRRVVGYTAFSNRVLEARWRLGWTDFLEGDHAEAREHFLAMVSTIAKEPVLDPDDAWRPRYWAARAAEESGQRELAEAELAELAAEVPLSYYGLRAQARLGRHRLAAAKAAPPIADGAGRGHVPYRRLQRAALLVDAGLAELARLELGEMAARPLGLDDRMAIGRVMVAAADFNGAERIAVDAFQPQLAQGLRPGVERLWWLAWPRAYPEIVTARAPALGVEPELVWAIMREESSFRPRVHSSAGAIGLMQLMPDTAQRVAERAALAPPEPVALERPEVNIELGTRYLGELAERMDGRVSAVVASYNAGPQAVARWLAEAPEGQPDDVFVENMPYTQTRSYARRVLRSYWLYQRLYD